VRDLKSFRAPDAAARRVESQTPETDDGRTDGRPKPHCLPSRSEARRGEPSRSDPIRWRPRWADPMPRVVRRRRRGRPRTGTRACRRRPSVAMVPAVDRAGRPRGEGNGSNRVGVVFINNINNNDATTKTTMKTRAPPTTRTTCR